MKQNELIKILALTGATLGTTGFLFFFLIIEKNEQNFLIAIPSLCIGLIGIGYLVFYSFKK